MTSTPFLQPFPRRVIVLAATTAAMIGTLLIPSSPASGHTNADPEGGNATLLEQLEAASRGYAEAQAALQASQARLAELQDQITETEAEIASLTEYVETLADATYRSGQLYGWSALLQDGSPDSLLDTATLIGRLAREDHERLSSLRHARDELRTQRDAVDSEIAEQQEQLAEMERIRDQVEQALTEAGGGEETEGPSASTDSTDSGAAAAAPAPRNPDGSWPEESCSVDDPTTDGCLTPRTLHALQEAQNAGFTRYVACFRTGGNGEHPKGRACDFAAQEDTFGGVATGDDREYGDNLAAWFVENADRLGVMYVIWFNQIWHPATGWRAYTNGDGTPSGDHTNHVHLSMY